MYLVFLVQILARFRIESIAELKCLAANSLNFNQF